MSYFLDDDASQIRDLKDKLEKLQSDILANQFSVSQENVESGQSTFPSANPSARGGTGSGSGGLTEPILFTITTLTPQTPPTKTDIDSALTNVFKITLDRNIEFDIINPNATKFEMLHVVITQDATTARTVTWPGSVNGTPSIDSALGSETTVSLFNMGNGSWRFVSTEGGVVGTGDNWSTFPAISTVDLDDNSLVKVFGIDMDGAAATIQGVVNLNFLQLNQSINSVSGQLSYQGAALDKHSFVLGGVEAAKIEEASAGVYRLDMLAHAIRNSREHSFDNSTEAIITSTEAVIGYSPTTEAGMLYNVPTGKEHIKKVNDVDIMTLSATNLTFVDGHQTIFNPDATNPGVNVGLVVGDPSATNNGDLWYNSTTNKFRTKENGVNVDVVGAGSEAILWTVDHDANGNSLILDADGDSSISSVSDDSIQIATGGSSELSVTNGFVTVPNSLIVNGNTTLGNASTDTITANARFNTTLAPSADDTYDLGITAANRWRDLWLSRNASVLGTMIVGGGSTFLGNVLMNEDVDLGASSADTIKFRGISGTDLDMNEFDITKIATASFFDGFGNSVAEIRANNASPDFLEIRLGSVSDFVISDNGTVRADYDNTLLTWSFQGSNVLKLPQETLISDRTSAPSTPSSGQASLYVINSGGAQSLHVKFDNGTSKEIANDT